MDVASIIAQQGEILRRRKLMEAMQGQNMQSPIVGGSKGASIGQALAKIATAYMLNQNGKGLAEEESSNRGQYQDALQDELNNYLQTREGTGSTVLPGSVDLQTGETGASTYLPPTKKANPREAVVSAMASQFPELQAIGKADFAGLRKEQMSTKDWLGFADKYDPESVIAAQQAGDPRLLKPKREFKEANGQIVNVTGEKPKVAFDARGRFGPTTHVNGEAVQFEEGTGKAHQVANRPASTKVSLSPTIKGEDAFSTALGKDVAEEFKTARQQALQGYNTKATVTQLKQLETNGIFSGPTANAAVILSNVAQTLGIPVDDGKLANTQAYQQQIAQKIASVLTAGGGVGRSMTDEDRKAFEKSLPTLLLSPQGRQYVFNQMERDADISIKRHKGLQERLMSNPMYAQHAGMLTINPVDGAPGLGLSPPTAPAANQEQRRPGQPTISHW